MSPTSCSPAPDAGSRFLPFQLQDLARLARPLWSDSQVSNFVSAFPKLGVQRLFEMYPESGHKLGLLLDTALIIVYKKTSSARNVYLLYDGRFDDRLENVADLKTLFVILGPSEQLWSVGSMDNFKPRLVVTGLRQYKPLSQLLQLESDKPDPKNVVELRAFFDAHRLPPDTQVNVHVVCASVPCQPTIYSAKLSFGSKNPARVIDVQARTGKDYNFIFKSQPPESVKIKRKVEAEPEPTGRRENVFYKNRSCAMRLSRFGLNLAYDLGLLSLSELARASEDLSQTVATLSAHFDEKKHLRLLVYDDCAGDPIALALNCKDERPEQSLAFFDKIYSRRRVLVQRRQDILTPLLDKLRNGRLENTKYALALSTLERHVQKQKIIFYDERDVFLHSFKFLLGNYVQSKKKNGLCRVPLQFGASKELVAMQTPEFCILNLFSYVEATRDETFRKLFEHRPVRILHRWAGLRKRSVPGGPTALDLCLEHSRLLAQQLQLQYQNLRKTFMDCLSYDICVWNAPSLAKLSFEAVEGRLARLKGPLGQGREKLKEPYDVFLRSSNRGGFVYSVQDRLSCGQLLHRQSDYTAKKICQYDIVSCYGFSAMTRLLPDKFCVGFFTQEFLQRAGSEVKLSVAPGVLVKTDGERCETFEFRAAYLTLCRLLESGESRDVRTVYSNFSPFGVLTIKKHVLDLAVTFDDGSLKMFNFDSIYSHGCESCPLLSRYISDAPLHVLRMKTLKRDATIRRWMSGSGLPDVTYDVITDCHHPDYGPSNLKKVFGTVSALEQLKQTCPKPKILTGEQLCDWLKLNQDKTDYTYLAWVRGSVSGGGDSLTPLALPPSQPSNSNYTLLSSTESVPVLLSREYLEFLNQNCNFQVSGIDAILFFGTDRRANDVYKSLVTARSETPDPVTSDLVKKITNFSVGFYGINVNSPKARYTLTNRLPRKSSVRTHQIVSDFGVKDWRDGPLLYVYKIQRNRRSVKSGGYLPLHVAVIEHGKLRLIEFFCFLQEHLRPYSFKLLYSNIDSFHIAFGQREWSMLVPPEKYQTFASKLASFVAAEKVAGMFNLDWSVTEKFMYVTARTRNYAVVAAGFEKTKWSGVRDIHPLEAYFKSCELLESGTSVTQERRTNKIQNTETEIKKMFCKPANK